LLLGDELTALYVAHSGVASPAHLRVHAKNSISLPPDHIRRRTSLSSQFLEMKAIIPSCGDLIVAIVHLFYTVYLNGH
jgi:hypothetical protein